MSGHSKWDTIHRDKAINDQKRGMSFTKVANAISLAVKESGGIADPGANFKLRLAIEKARGLNMPNEKIQKAIDRGLGKTDGVDLVETLYEGYVQGGIGVLVETLSDNHQRTVQEVKNIFDRFGGSIASPGSVAFNFVKRGRLVVGCQGTEKDELMLKLIDLGVEDVTDDGEELTVYVLVDQLETVKEKITVLNGDIISAEIMQKPINLVSVDQGAVKQVTAFLEKLNELDDVQKVYVNFSECLS